jgi:hypothetical protein
MSRFIKSPLSVLLSYFVWEIELIEEPRFGGTRCVMDGLRYHSGTGETWMQTRPCFGGTEDEGLRGYRRKDDASEAFVTTGTAMRANLGSGALYCQQRENLNSKLVRVNFGPKLLRMCAMKGALRQPARMSGDLR